MLVGMRLVGLVAADGRRGACAVVEFEFVGGVINCSAV